MKRILVVGGTGYLGQHVLAALSSSAAYHTAFTHHRPTPPPDLVAAVSGALALRVDLLTGDGFDAVSHAFGQPDVVINCAAISAPRACETDPEAAMGTNVPSSLVNWLARLDRGGGGEPLLIHLSTDQVYEGVKSFYKEEDETVPVNMYGKSKVAAEHFISSKCSNYAILRSSIIYGPQTISPVSKSLPIQWIDNVLSQGREVEFFHDEFRCPVYVQDVVNVILALIEKWVSDEKTRGLMVCLLLILLAICTLSANSSTSASLSHISLTQSELVGSLLLRTLITILLFSGFRDAKQMQLLLNLGGPDRVSRVQMAESVAAARGYSNSLIRAVPASSVNRGVVSPSDISMDISRLIQVLGITPVSFEAGVRSTLESTD